MADQYDFDSGSWDNRQSMSRRPRDTADYGAAGMNREDYAFNEGEFDELDAGRQRYYFSSPARAGVSRRMESDRMAQQREQDEWARRVRQNWQRGPYGDYGWESGESVLPEFRDPSVHRMPYDVESRPRRRSEERGASYRRAYDYENAPDIPPGRTQSRYPGGPGFASQGWYAPGPHTGQGPRNYQRSSERIREDINERLTLHGQIDATEIQVRVENGEVWLTGTVDSRQTKRMAEDVADSVAGVRDVHNELHMQSVSDQSPAPTAS